MTNLQVTEWSRYGRRRLYFKNSDGIQVGWYDPIGNRAVLEATDYSDDFERALTEYGILHGLEVAHSPLLPSADHPVTESLASEESDVVEHPAPPDPELSELPKPSGPAIPVDLVEEPWRDLCENLPGQAVLAKAAELQRESPVWTFIARITKTHNDERAFRIGGKGEQKVAHRLEMLPVGWKVLNSIGIGSGESDIDHLVIGPGGVYSINTKNHPDANIWVKGNTFMINGYRTPYVHKSRHEAKRVGRILSEATGIDVEPVGIIAPVGARGGYVVKSQPEDSKVFILTPSQLVPWMTSRPISFEDEVVRAIFDHARRSTTWR
ncbi:MAG: NERD domain-containing protein [Acidimicrobiaceae bacterium]|nr:NERD domain-containing protein [Acidimicrobiaceae bacterium]